MLYKNYKNHSPGTYPNLCLSYSLPFMREDCYVWSYSWLVSCIFRCSHESILSKLGTFGVYTARDDSGLIPIKLSVCTAHHFFEVGSGFLNLLKWFRVLHIILLCACLNFDNQLVYSHISNQNVP